MLSTTRPPSSLVYLGAGILAFLVLVIAISPADLDLERQLQDKIVELELVRDQLAIERKRRFEAEAKLARFVEAEKPKEELKSAQYTSEESIRIFQEEMLKGCQSTKAVFKKRWLLGWVLWVPEGGELRVGALFPEDKNKIERALEEIGAGDDVHFGHLLRHLGEC